MDRSVSRKENNGSKTGLRSSKPEPFPTRVSCFLLRSHSPELGSFRPVPTIPSSSMSTDSTLKHVSPMVPDGPQTQREGDGSSETIASSTRQALKPTRQPRQPQSAKALPRGHLVTCPQARRQRCQNGRERVTALCEQNYLKLLKKFFCNTYNLNKASHHFPSLLPLSSQPQTHDQVPPSVQRQATAQ